MVYLPFELINSLGLKEGEEIDFFKHPDSDKYFIVAKKSDIANLITHQKQQQQPQKVVVMQQQSTSGGPNISGDELSVLKKLDAIRYNDRTAAKLKQVLNSNERKVLIELIKKKYVAPFKKAGEQTSKYGIAKNIYNKYLYGKREAQKGQQQQQQKTVTIQIPQITVPQTKKWDEGMKGSHAVLDALEQNGFLVVANQAEASEISTELEQSIRTGQVIGTRAFNKKYYITLKAFVSKNATRVFKAIGTKSTPVSEISKATGIDEEGIRAILYILAENGEVTETRKDIFRVV